MPSYARLFADGNPRGEALVAYLASLGEAHAADRLREVAAWVPPRLDGVASRGKARFDKLCAGCHGRTGAGDGPLVARLSLKPPAWPVEGWRHVRVDDETAGLVRIIRFGLPGGAMAGHEYLPDAEVADLAAHVSTLVRRSP
jgi:cytochrome c oxidase cbb3-type subunit 2